MNRDRETGLWLLLVCGLWLATSLFIAATNLSAQRRENAAWCSWYEKEGLTDSPRYAEKCRHE